MPRGAAIRRTSFLALAVTAGLIAQVPAVVTPAASATPAWKIVKAPNPARSTEIKLFGVSCPSPTSCFAVGSAKNLDGSLTRTLVEHWNGKTWTIQTSPNPTGSYSAFLYAVSCPTPTSCFAVGTVNNATRPVKTLVERWNGRTWAIQTTPNPAGSLDVFLSGVSCPTPTSCFAVGSASSSSSPATTLVERWNGKTWTIQASPNPAGSLNVFLSGVSCPTPTSCFAVGNSDGLPVKRLVERWNGKTWTIHTIPDPTGSPYASVNGVSCPSPTSCYAVGSVSPAEGTSMTLVEHWNGKTWAMQASPNPPHTVIAGLSGVACPTLTNCFAVGADDNDQTLVERLNGKTWAIQTSPNPTGSPNLVGVACPNPTNCFAVGWYPKGSLIERYA